MLTVSLISAAFAATNVAIYGRFRAWAGITTDGSERPLWGMKTRSRDQR
jgi:hypothetical protein